MSMQSLSRGGRLTTAFLLTAALAACTGPEGPEGAQGPEGPQGQPGPVGGLDPALGTADKTIRGMGGLVAIQGLTSFTVEAEGNRLMLGENFAPEGGSVTVSAFSSTTTHDVANDAFRIDWDRQFFFIPGTRTYSEVVNADLGYVSGSDSVFVPPDPAPQAAMPSDRMAGIRKEQRLLNPQLIVRDVAATPEIASAGGYALHDGVLHELLVVEDPVAPITLYVNPATGHISKLETWENDHLRRDVLVEVFYADWQGEANQVPFPGVVFVTLAGEVLHAETRAAFTANATVDAGLFAIPTLDPAPVFDATAADRGMHSHQYLQQFASLGIPNPGVQANIQAIPLDNDDPALAKVFHLTGGTHHSLAIKQAGGVVIAEAPLYPERSQAIMDWVETQFGAGTTVTHVISTHHHFDHAGGLREFVAAGAQIVLQQSSRVFFEGIFRAASTVVPDTLSMTPAAQPSIQSVQNGGFLRLDDADAPVEAYHVATSHASDMLLIYVPIAGNEIVFVSDIFSPGFPAGGPGPGETLRSIEDDHQLVVAKIVGGHGFGFATLDQLRAIVNPPAPAGN